MHSYSDADYYRSIYKGGFKGTGEELNRLLYLASRKIDELTFNRIVSLDFDSLTNFRKQLIRQACCLQADFYAENGTDSRNTIQSYSVLDISVSYNNSTSPNSAARLNGVSESAYMLINQTGLMSRGV